MQKRAGEGREGEHAAIFRALAAVLAERGGGAVAPAAVAARAGISKAKLQARFADLESCFLAAFEWCSEQGGSAMTEAYAGEHGWVEGVRSALAALLKLIEAEPDLARLWIVYALGAGPRVLRARVAAIATLAEHIDRGRSEARVRAEPPAITAEGVVGAVLVVLQTRLLAPEEVRPSELRGELMSLILLPYLGAAAARRELARPVRFRPRPQRLLAAGKLDAGQRVTYRTARVLSAIAERPGASNREVANHAEVVDQGQISKLLSRLEAQGLIANVGGGGLRGAPNAWELTLRGEQIQQRVAAMAAPARRRVRR
ncbi:MAG TPA: helix-turn-helix domain-containing protein [Solirubrobacteraceae bacterium]|nr:helix-turn-helix domain-containing protein [Solirubrobacteraceae bacterium]